MLKLAKEKKKAIEWKRLWDKDPINKESGVSVENCLPKWCSLVLAKYLLNSFLTLHHLSLSAVQNPQHSDKPVASIMHLTLLREAEL